MIIDGLKIAREIAKKRGGRCLADKYINSKTKMEWECIAKHVWSASLDNVNNKNTWCRKCADIEVGEKRRLKNGLKIAQQIAKKHGGRCLSNEYISCNVKMGWECRIKHRWSAIFSHIKRGSWCPKCAVLEKAEKRKLKNGLKIAQQIAKNHGGKCLSNEYINNNTKMEWECKVKHRWSANLTNIKDGGQWCYKCHMIRQSKEQILKNGLKIAQQIAKKHGGRCLSNEYISCRSPMLWECKVKHRWSAALDTIKNGGTWCQKCGYLISAKNQTNSTILKHWKTGENLICQASYEKAVVKYLNKNKINFRWQSRTFTIHNNKTYRPDMYLFSIKKWIEIKGYFRKDAQEKWDWFHKAHPNSELWNKATLTQMKII